MECKMHTAENYKDMYEKKYKELLSIKISLNPYWEGDTNEYRLEASYSLEELENIWFRLVETEHEDSYNTEY